ncbi:MAG TPA: hypothetical protein VGS19_01560 [Streptosporangiaceae bacterium]|nr:hypothetical protein [Streptosporangiaceae bacterium]
MRLGSSVSAVLLGGILAALVSGVAACGQPRPCAGQCGPPFQLRVGFHTGISARAAASVMGRCASKPFVVSVGQVVRTQGLLVATVYTESMRGQQSDRLVACLRRSPSVIGAGYPD